MTITRPEVAEPENPVHMRTSPDVRWTTVNFAEAIQGVQTPLGWTFWSLSMETALRRTFWSMGVLSGNDLPIPANADRRISGIFYGRAAGNITVFRWLGDRTPGSSGDTVEEKLFGKVAQPGGPGRPRQAYLRYPVVAAKLPAAALRAPGQIRRLRAEYRGWWQRVTLDEPPADLAAAQALLRDAVAHFVAIGVHHAVASMLGVQLLEQLDALVALAGDEDTSGSDLATGYGAMEETAIFADIWAAAQGELGPAELTRRHGYHGPDEGDLSSRSWREDPQPLESLVEQYRERRPVGPDEREAVQRERREAAQARVLARLPARRRPQARLVMRLARTYIPARECGKAGFLHTVDAARCAARAAGRILADRGDLAEPDDVFFLTYDELLGPLDGQLTDVVAERKERQARYRDLALPPEWTGNPVPVVIDTGAPAGDTPPVSDVRGIGVVGGEVTGRARILHDPRSADLAQGDILVCRTTDPSWTPLFMLAEALVIDTGGSMSHGAIVARELGVTCVINTVTGTRDIPEGATVTVNGATGLVTIA